MPGKPFSARMQIGTLLSRVTALSGAQVIFYPTSIGWHPHEKAEFGAAQLDAWKTIQRAHADRNSAFSRHSAQRRASNFLSHQHRLASPRKSRVRRRAARCLENHSARACRSELCFLASQRSAARK